MLTRSLSRASRRSDLGQETKSLHPHWELLGTEVLEEGAQYQGRDMPPGQQAGQRHWQPAQTAISSRALQHPTRVPVPLGLSLPTSLQA